MDKDLDLPRATILFQKGTSARCLSNIFDHEPKKKFIYVLICTCLYIIGKLSLSK